MSLNTTYSLNNVKRDLYDVWETLRQKTPGVLGIIGTSDRTLVAKKLEWLNDVDAYENDTLNNGGALVAADTTVTVSDGTKFRANMIIKLRGYPETIKVASVSGNVLTIERNYNSTGATTTIPDGTVVEIINEPKTEGSRAGTNTMEQLTTSDNYWEIFRQDIAIPDETLNTRQYGFQTADAFMNYQVEKFMKKLRTRINRSVMYGKSYVGTSTAPATMNGIYTFIDDASGNRTDASGATLTAAMINNARAAIFEDDVSADDLVIVCNTHQARTMAGFNTSLANRFETVAYDSMKGGGNTAINVFVGDLAPLGVSRVIVEKDFPIEAVAILNTRKINLVFAPDGRPYDWDTTPTDYKGKQRSIYARCSLEMKDALYSHALIKNLATS